MNMLLHKYREHEALAEAAAAKKEFDQVVFHLTRAAAFCIELAKLSHGSLSSRYLQDANEKMELAEKLRGRKNIGHAPSTMDKSVPSEDSAVSSFLLKEKPSIRMKDVVGMESLKRRLDEAIIMPYLHPEKYRKKGLDDNSGGVLLYGPPGTGKTYIARALAGELDCPFFNVDPSQLVDKYIGETPKKIAALFDEVRKHPQAIVFIDEVTQLLGQNEAIEKTGAIEQMFRETDGLSKSSRGFMLLMATNYPWNLPAPMLRQGRTRDAIYIGLPDAPARLAMLEHHLKGCKLGTEINLAALGDRLDGYSAAEVAGIVRRAKEKSLLREIQLETDDEPVSGADMETSLSEVRPASSKADVEKYLAWGSAHQKR